MTARSHSGGILVVDDDATLATTLQEFLQREGYRAEVALSAPEALVLMERNPRLHLALVDLIMPEADGLTLMDEIHRRNPDIPVVIMTGFGTIETAVEAIKRGAEDYLTKPFDQQAVRKKVARLMEIFELRERVAQLEANLERSASFENFISVSPIMQRLVERARMASSSDAPVLVLGETGTGKEKLAQAIHAASRRADRPFLPVNCGGLPRDLVESEMFGFRRGAFTGAHADSAGIFASAAGGTVFLDEIGEMPRETQVKFLRVLEDRELRPLGSAKPVKVDFRLVSATNRPLSELRAGCLREDLYFRIATVTLDIPPLRSRPEDILVMAQHFAATIGRRYGRELTLSRSAIELLLGYAFPGNVRELQNLIESAAAVSNDDPQCITEKNLQPLLQETSGASRPAGLGEKVLSVEQTERLAIERALRLCQGNRTRAASLLGISRDTLYRKLRQYGGTI